MYVHMYVYVGPQPDWDPDIVAALDSLDVSSADQGEEEGEGEGEGNGEEGEVEGEGEEESDELEDDFVLKVRVLVIDAASACSQQQPSLAQLSSDKIQLKMSKQNTDLIPINFLNYF